MVELKTKQNDAFAVLENMKTASGEQPKMWGGSSVGFGLYGYKYASRRGGEWMTIGFSPRKQNMSLYLMCGLEALQPFLSRLGKHKTGKGCLYINKLSDVDLSVSNEMIEVALKRMDQ